MDHTREADANRLHGRARHERGDLGAHRIGDLLCGERLQRAGGRRAAWIQADRRSQRVVGDQSHGDVLHRQHADRVCHGVACPLR